MKTPNEIFADAGDADGLPKLAWGSVIRKYSKIMRITLIERFTYRADFFLTTFFRFIPMLTTILLWSAVFRGGDSKSMGNEETGMMFTYKDMIAYLLLTQISRAFSSMPGLAGGIARDVREGTLKRFLVQPLDMIGYLFAFRVAHKAAYITMSFLPYALLFWLCRDYFVSIPQTPEIWIGYLLSLLLAFQIGFFFELSVGMVGFWMLEITSLLYIMMTLNFFVSGHMFPLDLLPPFWVTVLKWLPFHYMAYFPAVVFLGKVTGPDLWWGLAIEVAWVFGFFLLARWLFARGLKHYGAYGG